MRAEQALRFGAEAGLLGILNHSPGDAAVACLLLNVGVTHRIGPRRLNVKLARALGAAGVASLRFDLSGIGDSGAAGPNDEYRSRSVADLCAAMDQVAHATGIERFVVLGVCSGAVNGWRAAQVDRRVVGLMMFDGYAYPTWTTHLVHNWRRLRTTPLHAVAGKVAARIGRWLGVADSRRVSIFYAASERASPTRAAFADALDALAARGVQLLVVYSGSVLQVHNHDAQFARAFAGRAFLRATDHRYLPHIDHVATPLAAQAELIALVTRWVCTVVAPATARDGASLVFDQARRDALAV